MATIWPRWTFAAKLTVSSAIRSMVAASNAAVLVALMASYATARRQRLSPSAPGAGAPETTVPSGDLRRVVEQVQLAVEPGDLDDLRHRAVRRRADDEGARAG